MQYLQIPIVSKPAGEMQMTKKIRLLIFLLIYVVFVISCSNTNPTAVNSISPQNTPSPEISPDNSSDVNSQENQYAKINSRLCDLPCFLEINPGQTNIVDANNYLEKYGFQPGIETDESTSAIDSFDNGTNLQVILYKEKDIVQSIVYSVTPGAFGFYSNNLYSYSLYTLFSELGSPDKIQFFVGTVEPNPSYAMDIYYSERNLIVEYQSYELFRDITTDNIKICPVTDQLNYVKLFFGKELKNVPQPGIDLENASNLGIEDFTNQLLLKNNDFCISLKYKSFEE
jgi:hypothetical protein